MEIRYLVETDAMISMVDRYLCREPGSPLHGLQIFAVERSRCTIDTCVDRIETFVDPAGATVDQARHPSRLCCFFAQARASARACERHERTETLLGTTAAESTVEGPPARSPRPDVGRVGGSTDVETHARECRSLELRRAQRTSRLCLQLPRTACERQRTWRERPACDRTTVRSLVAC